MERRKFITGVGAAIVGATAYVELLHGAMVIPATPTLLGLPTKRYTVSDIIHVSWPAMLQEIHGERGNSYSRLVEQGKIIVRALGDRVECDGHTYDVEEVRIPIVWSISDENKLDTENKKISFVAEITRNGIGAFDSLLEEMLDTSKMLILSKQYSYYLSETHMYNGAYICPIYTALARVV